MPAPPIHHFCLFFRDGRLDSGWVEAVQKNKLVVQPLQGKTQFLPETRLLHTWPPPTAFPDLAKALAELPRQLEQAETHQQAHDLETMHGLCEAGGAYTLGDLTETFLTDPEDVLDQVGLLLALQADERWFRRTRNQGYVPRSAEELAQLDAQLARKQARAAKIAQIQEWIRQLEDGEWTPETPRNEAQEDWLVQLVRLLAEGREAPHWKEFAPLLGLGPILDVPEQQRLRRLLALAGRPVSTGRLILLQAQVRDRFSKPALEAVSAIHNLPLPDLPTLPESAATVTIDSEKTRDYDDAFTVLEWRLNSLVLAVHITDLTHAIPPGSPLFAEAEARASSVYTLEATHPMLPPELAEETFSLRADTERAVLSYRFQLFRNGSWQLQDITPQRIRTDENLSYAEADERIAAGHEYWGLLHECCEGLLGKRVEDGALNLRRTEFEIDISNPDAVAIQPLNRNSPANRIIEELAVLVNRETARFFQEREAPGIFRTQAPYEVVGEVKEGEELALEHLSLEAARLTTVPGLHAGLACEPYMQTTSPIRRFPDLVTQHQLQALLREADPPFSKEDLMRWAELSEVRQKGYARAEREVIRHWKTRYLSQHLGAVFEAKIRRQFPNQVTEFELEAIAYVFQSSGFATREKGERMLLRVDEVSVEPVRVEVSVCEPSSDLEIHQLEVEG
ncbi:MAG TPA: RNB domain-containing ribonuclease [Deltaproteobacteria bacterium]|nr:RNB domain-containing ribonuclease [Deltaproteobacteria bacterium]